MTLKNEIELELQLNTFVQPAVEAAVAANSATARANSAADAANNAADRVDASIAAATQAASSANDATRSAEDAAAGARGATEAAHAAATNAVNATINANTATGNANTATGNANTATAHANQSAQEAQAATLEARNAASAAAAATTAANAATDYANREAAKATEAAVSVDASKTRAEEAAQNADTAASSAANAAKDAAAATTDAQTAAQTASAAAQTADAAAKAAATMRATVEKTGDTATITITDADGTQRTASISDAPQISDSPLTYDNPPSGAGIVDRLCPAFEASGAVVTCTPVEGYPLRVSSRIEATQAGEGTPGPENVRAIAGWDAVTRTHNGQTRTDALPETVYGGTLDWNTGVLTADWGGYSVTGEEAWAESAYPPGDASLIRFDCRVSDARKAAEGYGDNLLCSHFPSVSANKYGVWINGTAGAVGLEMRVCLEKTAYADVEALKAWLSAQHAAGTPVQFVYRLSQPYTIQLTAQQTTALAGVNTLFTDTGETTVSGRSDPVQLIHSLMERIAALEAAAVNA